MRRIVSVKQIAEAWDAQLDIWGSEDQGEGGKRPKVVVDDIQGCCSRHPQDKRMPVGRFAIPPCGQAEEKRHPHVFNKSAGDEEKQAGDYPPCRAAHLD